MKKVLVIGSCVSRDAFNINGAECFEVTNYVARSSLGSAFASQIFSGVGLDSVSSEFQRRVIQIDLDKSLENIIRQSDVDFILLDLIDERFNLFQNSRGEICTLSNELISSGFNREIKSGRIIESGSDEFLQLWLVGWHRFLKLLDELRALSKLRVSRVLWAESLENGTNFEPGYPLGKIRAANDFLERLYLYIERDLPKKQFIEFDRNMLKGSINHRWGNSPFHYVGQVYKKIIDRLSSTQPYSSIDFAENGLQLGQIELNATMRWFEIPVPDNTTLLLEATITGSSGVTANRALISVDFGHSQPEMIPGFAMSRDQSVGLYRYLNTGEGSHTTRFSFEIPPGCRGFRFGVRSWWSEGGITLESLNLRVSKCRPMALVSVDVEALTGRAEADHVNRLIYGRFGNGFSGGIERICDIFDRYGVKGTFFVDYSTTPIHGEAGIFEAAQLIAQRGHEVQLHLHAEVLVRHMGWSHDLTKMPSFEFLDQSTARRCLEFGLSQYQKNLGKLPTVFRPGGMRHSRAMYEAACDVGIKYVSAIYRRFHDELWPSVQDAPTLLLDNGVIEIPLDIPLDPLVNWRPFDSAVRRICGLRAPFPAVSLLLHSTSLLIRPRDDGISAANFYGYHEPYEKQLCEYLEILASHCEFLTYSDYLGRRPPTREMSFERLYPTAPIDRETPSAALGVDAEKTPARTEPKAPLKTYRLSAFSERENSNEIMSHVPPTNLPVRLAPGQRLAVVYADELASSGQVGLAYVLNGTKAHLMRNRAGLPPVAAFDAMKKAIFDRHPLVDRIVAESVLEDSPIDDYASKLEVRRAYVLDLPDDFETYRTEVISPRLRYDIEREERRVQEQFPGMRFVLDLQNDARPDRFSKAAELIEAHLFRKTSASDSKQKSRQANSNRASWHLYRERGALVTLETGEQIFAAALCLFDGKNCYFMAAGHDELSTKYSLGKILLYRLIMELIARGVSRLHLGGGDFGYKSRFGAIERPMYTIEFLRPQANSLQDRVKTALSVGERLSVIEKDIGISVEAALANDFEKFLGVDFDRLADPSDIGLDRTASRYQATMGEAFFTLMKAIKFAVGDVFVDVGSGTGNIIYYAARLGFKKCIGIELSESLLEQSRKNLERMQLDVDIELWQRNAALLDPQELAFGNVFYLYNPFGESIVDAFLNSLVASQRISPRTIKVVYCNARHKKPFERHGFKTVNVFEQGSLSWRFDTSLVFEHTYNS